MAIHFSAASPPEVSDGEEAHDDEHEGDNEGSDDNDDGDDGDDEGEAEGDPLDDDPVLPRSDDDFDEPDAEEPEDHDEVDNVLLIDQVNGDNMEAEAIGDARVPEVGVANEDNAGGELLDENPALLHSDDEFDEPGVGEPDVAEEPEAQPAVNDPWEVDPYPSSEDEIVSFSTNPEAVARRLRGESRAKLAAKHTDAVQEAREHLLELSEPLAAEHHHRLQLIAEHTDAAPFDLIRDVTRGMHTHQSRPQLLDETYADLAVVGPPTLNAMAAIIRSPGDFKAEDHPGALIRSSEYVPGPDDEATLYLRVRCAPAQDVVTVCDAYLERAPHDIGKTQFLRQAAESAPAGSEHRFTELYAGVTVATTPEGRQSYDLHLARDLKSSTRITNRLMFRDGHDLFPWKTYVWKDFTVRFPPGDLLPSQLLRESVAAQQREQLIIDCLGLTAWNSAVGGTGGPNYTVMTAAHQAMHAQVWILSYAL